MRELQNDIQEIENVLDLWFSSSFSIPDIENFLNKEIIKDMSVDEMKIQFKISLFPKFNELRNMLQEFYQKFTRICDIKFYFQ